MKQGSAADRKNCADYLRQQRALPPSGRWTRQEWNRQLFVAGRNRLARLTAARKTMRVIEAECQDDARRIVKLADQFASVFQLES